MMVILFMLFIIFYIYLFIDYTFFNGKNSKITVSISFLLNILLFVLLLKLEFQVG